MRIGAGTLTFGARTLTPYKPRGVSRAPRGAHAESTPTAHTGRGAGEYLQAGRLCRRTPAPSVGPWRVCWCAACAAEGSLLGI